MRPTESPPFHVRRHIPLIDGRIRIRESRSRRRATRTVLIAPMLRGVSRRHVSRPGRRTRGARYRRRPWRCRRRRRPRLHGEHDSAAIIAKIGPWPLSLPSARFVSVARVLMLMLLYCQPRLLLPRGLALERERVPLLPYKSADSGVVEFYIFRGYTCVAMLAIQYVGCQKVSVSSSRHPEDVPFGGLGILVQLHRGMLNSCPKGPLVLIRRSVLGLGFTGPSRAVPRPVRGTGRDGGLSIDSGDG